MKKPSYTAIAVVAVLAVLTQTQAAITEEDAEAYKKWPSWGFHERLNFLLYEEDWANFRTEFFQKDVTRSNSATLQDFVRVHSDFMETERIEEFFQACVDADDSDDCDYISYVVARGDYDQNGNPFDNNEWEMRESMFIKGFEDAVNNPHISEAELAILGMKIGEDGIIEEL
ncbi:hypothetical protein TrVE_jg12778 [Triparma verrucosa]|uniref:Uncharacterized protein n=1 Tax=Triparma verrucosa TaxID=1606542 RepID=A0A9W7CA68_9STRA|nr:hypothetical protein TrVE_jg12778 [Triparma verrucosa]